MTSSVAAEALGGASRVNSDVTMTLDVLHHLHCSSQQATTVCLPVSVQLLTYDNDDFVDTAATAAAADDDDDDDDDDVEPETMTGLNVAADHSASTSANVSNSTPV